MDSPGGYVSDGDSACLCQVGHMFCNCWEYVGIQTSSSACSGSCSTPSTKLYGDYCRNHGNDGVTCAPYTVFWTRPADPAKMAPMSSTLGLVQSEPGSSCKDIRDRSLTGDVDGQYWITVQGNTFLSYCDMTTAGGGWLMTYKVKNDNDDQVGPNYFQEIVYGSGNYGNIPNDLSLPSGWFEGPTIVTRHQIWSSTGASEMRATSYTDSSTKMTDIMYPVGQVHASDTSSSFSCLAAGCGNGSPSTGYSNAWLPGLATSLMDSPGGYVSDGDSACLCQVGHMFCNCWEYVGIQTSSSACSGSCSTPSTKLYGDYCRNHGNDGVTCAPYTVFWVR